MTGKAIGIQHSAFRMFRLAAGLGLLALMLGCATAPWTGFPTRTDPRLIWPQPPEPARVAYVMTIRSQEDLFATAGFWHAVGELVAGKADTALVRPYAVALHPEGGLLVADPGRSLVLFYNWNKRRTIEIGPKRKGGMPSPVGLAALPDGRILVSDSRLGTVETFAADGKYLGPFCPKGTLGRPAGIAASAARGEVYVADVINHCVKVFDLNGTLKRTIGSHGDGPEQFNFPTHLALDPQGRLLVTDSLNFRVQIFLPDGKHVGSFGQLGDAPGQFSKPKGIASDRDGNIIVVEGLYGVLEFFDPQGRLLLSLGKSGHASGEFWLPAGIGADWKEGLVFVADSYNKRVQVFRIIDRKAP